MINIRVSHRKCIPPAQLLKDSPHPSQVCRTVDSLCEMATQGQILIISVVKDLSHASPQLLLWCYRISLPFGCSEMKSFRIFNMQFYKHCLHITAIEFQTYIWQQSPTEYKIYKVGLTTLILNARNSKNIKVLTTLFSNTSWVLMLFFSTISICFSVADLTPSSCCLYHHNFQPCVFAYFVHQIVMYIMVLMMIIKKQDRCWYMQASCIQYTVVLVALCHLPIFKSSEMQMQWD